LPGAQPRDILTRDGYNVSIVQQPETSLADDVKATTQAGINPQVAGLVYVAAFQPDVGESLLTLAKNAASQRRRESRRWAAVFRPCAVPR
jgi:hypothetical protein